MFDIEAGSDAMPTPDCAVANPPAATVVGVVAISGSQRKIVGGEGVLRQLDSAPPRVEPRESSSRAAAFTDSAESERSLALLAFSQALKTAFSSWRMLPVGYSLYSGACRTNPRKRTCSEEPDGV